MVIKSRSMRWSGYAVRKPEGKRTLPTTRYRQEDMKINIK
jgi:hypothetical protein